MTQYIKYDDLRWPQLKCSWEERLEKAAKVLHDCQEQVKLLTNDQLFDDYTSLQGGDDWEGAITLGGQQALAALSDELVDRLVAIGFLAR